MTVRLDHTIVWCRDQQTSADFLAGMLGLAPATRGVYWPDPDGHLLEVITRPYGSGG